MSSPSAFLDVVLYVASGVAGAIALHRWRVRRQRPVAGTGALLLACSSLWCLTSALTLSSPDLATKMMWQRVQFFAIIPVPLLWFILALQFAGLGGELTRLRILLLCIPPVVLLALLPLDASTHLILVRGTLVDRGDFLSLQREYGPALWAYFFYGHLQVLIASGILGWRMIRAPGFARSGALLLSAVTLTVVANVVDFMPIFPEVGFELTPLALLLAVPVFAVILIQMERKDLLHYARGSVIETMHDGLVVVDIAGRIVDINPAAEGVFGVRRSRVLRRRLSAIWPGWDQAGAEAGVTRRLADFVTIAAGSRPEAYEVSASALPDALGRPSGEVLVLRNVTARRQAEAALQESEERLRSIFESTLVGVYQVTPDGRVLFANRALAKMLGADPSGEIHDRAPAWATDLLLGDMPRVPSSSSHVRGRIKAWRRPNGSLVHLRQTARPIVESNGSVRYYEGTLEDVTELVDTRDELKRRARYLETLNRVIAACASRLDVQGMMDACLDGTLEALGLAAGVIWARHHQCAVGLPEDMRSVVDGLGPAFTAPIEIVDAARPQAGPLQAVAEAMRASGLGSLLAYPLIMDGRRAGGLVVAALEPRVWRPEEVQLGAAIVGEVAAGLQRAHAIEAASHQDRLAAVGQLAAGIAHDFNNMLGAVILHTEMLSNEPGLSPRGLARTRTIQEQVSRASSLVAQVLDFSRRSVLEIRPVDLRQFLSEQLDLLRRTLPETLRLGMTVDDGSHVIEADLTRLQQLLLNLSTNARDAMPDGGRLSFTLRSVSLSPGDARPFSSMLDGEWVVLDVADSGPGLPAEIRTHLFEPFFTTKPPGKGTGLGLSQVYGIVKQHGGYIDVDSAIGGGTIFTIYLPLLSEPPRRPTALAAPAPRGAGETILVVEDESAIRDATIEILEGLGYRVLSAEDGRAALAVHANHPGKVRLVICDVVMPEMGGEDLCVELMRRQPDLRVILVSGYPFAATGQLRRAPCTLRLQKPLTAAALAGAVQAALAPMTSSPSGALLGERNPAGA